MPGGEEDEGNDQQEELKRIFEALEDEDELTGPPEAVNPDPTTRTFGSAVGARLARQDANTSDAKRVDNPTARGFSAAFGERAAKLSISKPLPKAEKNSSERAPGAALDTRAAKLSISKPPPKQIEKQTDTPTAHNSRTSSDTRAAKLRISKPLPKQIERISSRTMTR